MDAVVERQSHIPFHSKPSVQEPAQIVRQFSVDDLTGLLRANENTISSLANERAIDPPTLRTQLLLHLLGFSRPTACPVSATSSEIFWPFLTLSKTGNVHTHVAEAAGKPDRAE
jgi:hypothetical protein